MKAQIAAPIRQGGEEADQCRLVTIDRRTETERRPVAEDDVDGEAGVGDKVDHEAESLASSSAHIVESLWMTSEKPAGTSSPQLSESEATATPPRSTDPAARAGGRTTRWIYGYAVETGVSGLFPKERPNAGSGLRSAPPIARIAKPMPESSRAIPTTMPNSAVLSAM